MNSEWEKRMSAKFAKFLSEVRLESNSPTFSKGPSKAKVVHGRCIPCNMRYNDPRFTPGVPCIHCKTPLSPPAPPQGGGGKGGGSAGTPGTKSGGKGGKPSAWTQDAKIARAHRTVADWRGQCAKVRADVGDLSLVIPAPPDVTNALQVLDSITKEQAASKAATTTPQPTPEATKAFEDAQQVYDALLAVPNFPTALLETRKAELEKLRVAAAPPPSTSTKDRTYFLKQLAEEEAKYEKATTKFDQDAATLAERQRKLDVATAAHQSAREAATASHLALRLALQSAMDKLPESTPTTKQPQVVLLDDASKLREQLREAQLETQTAVMQAERAQADELILRAQRLVRDLGPEGQQAAHIFGRLFQAEVVPGAVQQLQQGDDDFDAPSGMDCTANPKRGADHHPDGASKNARTQEPDAPNVGKGVGSVSSAAAPSTPTAATPTVQAQALAAAHAAGVEAIPDSDEEMAANDNEDYLDGLTWAEQGL